MATASPEQAEFQWRRQPDAAAWLGEVVDSCCRACTPLAELRERLLRETGTRLVDWIDHVGLPADDPAARQLTDLGFERFEDGPRTIREHPGGLFPAIVVGTAVRQLAIKSESVADFMAAQGLDNRTEIDGQPLAAFRKLRVASAGEVELWVVERHGYSGLDSPDCTEEEIAAVLIHREAFRLRRREFPRDEEGFAHAHSLIQEAAGDLGVDRACDLFFAAEREYWQQRNRAAQVQKARQDALGLGWANHDHHTYRSSREHFSRLVRTLETLGFTCRERFYAGSEAGWGAQVLEQPGAGIVIFADVDLSADELAGDFAHEPLPPQKELGTVGLWCKLHGEAFLQAGMHHLECQFDFDAAREQLAAGGVETMAPFTDFDYLKQAFTVGDTWPVAEERIAAALAEGYIDQDQAEQFRTRGAVGSHLEILQRNEGYKGFNQTGISEIIKKTDPRRQ